MRGSSRSLAALVLGLILSGALQAGTQSALRERPLRAATASPVRAPAYRPAVAHPVPLVPGLRAARPELLNRNRWVPTRRVTAIPARTAPGSGLSGNALRHRAPLSATLGGPATFDARKRVRR